jgi:hypothetical protein
MKRGDPFVWFGSKLLETRWKGRFDRGGSLFRRYTAQSNTVCASIDIPFD